MDSVLLNTGLLISEMNAVDPDASRFRYPTTKDDKPGLEFRRIDLNNLMARVGAVISVIEGVGECALQERASLANETRVPALSSGPPAT